MQKGRVLLPYVFLCPMSMGDTCNCTTLMEAGGPKDPRIPKKNLPVKFNKLSAGGAPAGGRPSFLLDMRRST